VKVVGILGGGQLARMLALAGHPLGLRMRVFDPSPDAPAAAVAEHICAAWDDKAAINRFCDGLDVATLETESLPVATAREVAGRVPMHPSPRALAATRDRLGEKALAHSLGIATAAFARVDSAKCMATALAKVGMPAVFKHRTLGYDGRGQAVVRSRAEAVDAWQRGGRRPSIVEKLVRFEREVSLVAVRSRRNEVAFYPLAENQHEDGILRSTIAPAPNVSPSMASQAQQAALAVLEALDYVGVITLEFFEKDGQLLLNEIAPRVHNSGHWSIEGAVTSQFENHMRAVTGLPLGATSPRGWCLLRNILGSVPDAGRVLSIPDTHLHLYGKEPRHGRKLGHVTTRVESFAAMGERIVALREAFGESTISMLDEP